jgi:hypothetical protein
VTATPHDEPDELEPDRDDALDEQEDEYLDEQEEDSFPASDPHSDWSGPRPEPA